MASAAMAAVAVISLAPGLAVAAPGGHGHTYQFVTTAMTWADAAQYAVDQGGHLASISSSGENEQVLALTGGTWAWLGANDVVTEGAWRWIDGKWFLGGPGNQAVHRYANWAANEPSNGYGDEDCLMMWGLGTWNDASCSTPMGFVIEWG